MTREGMLLTTGVVGTIVTTLCGFTPVLVLGLGALGLATWFGWPWFDYVEPLTVPLEMPDKSEERPWRCP